MLKKINRREVLATAGAVAAASAVSTNAFAQGAPAIMSGYRPMVVGSGNGHWIKNADGLMGVEISYRKIIEGVDVLDALIEGVNLNEEDPEDRGVGYGGLPDAEGNVTLDSSVMHGPKRMAGAVGYIQGVVNPSKVARDVMYKTDHHLIAGQGAQDFAREQGYEILDDLNTDKSRKLYNEWKEETDRKAKIDSATNFEKHSMDVSLAMMKEGKIDPNHFFGTINANGMNSKGDICGVTTTSGLGWKKPGRIGDSPILGAGLYVDNDYGAAGSTGRGESNMYSCASFLIVEKLREGMHPKDAAIYALKRIAEQTTDKYRNEMGEPGFGLSFYVLDKKGRHGGATMHARKDYGYAVHTENGPELVILDGVFSPVS